MTLDPTFLQQNQAATARIRALAGRLSEAELHKPVGEHWTVAITLAHLAFWDLRVLNLLEQTGRAGKLVTPQIDVSVNDIALPQWAAIPPRAAAQMAVTAAEELDRRLAELAPGLLEELHTFNARWVRRSLHRGEHLDEIDAALAK